MSTPLIVLVTLIYAAIAVDMARKGEWMGLTFAGYALANVGLILSLPK